MNKKGKEPRYEKNMLAKKNYENQKNQQQNSNNINASNNEVKKEDKKDN